MATISDFLVRIRGDVKDLTDKLNSVEKSVDTFAKNLTTSLGAAFAVDKLIDFGKHSVLLAAKAEGITNAFKKLNDATLLNELRKATRGTISDVDLMRGAVQANNFQIPLNTLASLFKFASIRARETGESVDFLTNSIVMGIARKSPLILDNLGINIKRIQTEFAKTGDFALAATTIVNEELKKSGDIALGAADKIAQWRVAWEGFSEETGKGFIDTMTGLGDAFTQLGNIFKPITDMFHSSGEETHYWSTALRFLTISLELTVRTVTAFLSPLRWLLELFQKIINSGIVQTFADIVSGMKAFISEGLKFQKIAAAFGLTVLTADLNATTDSIVSIYKPVVLLETGFKNTTKAIKDTTIEWDEWLKRLEATPDKLKPIKFTPPKVEGKVLGIPKMEFGEIPKLPFGETPMLEIKTPELAPAELFDSWLMGIELTKEEWGTSMDYMASKTQEFAGLASQFIGGFDAIFQQYMKNESITISNNEKKEIDALKKRGLSNEAFAEGKKDIEEKYQKQRSALAKKAAKQEKTMGEAQAVINGAVAVTKAFADLGPVAGAIAASAIGIMTGVQVALIQGQPIPDMAQGGLAYGATIRRIGEYPGASTNPEVVAPLNKLKDMMPQQELITRIRGEDIELVLQRTARTRQYS